MELAGAQTTHLVAIELGERGEHHGVDGYVDADAERIGAADDGQQALLCQALDQQTIARQHAGMVHADAASKQTFENLVPFAASLMASRCSLLAMPKLASDCAVARAASWLKCTI